MKIAKQSKVGGRNPSGKGDQDGVLTAIAQETRRQLPSNSYTLYLFGSRAGEEATARSDYDIGLQSHSPLSLAEMARLRARLDALPILQKIDLVDLNRASSAFSHKVRSSGQVIDER